MYRYIYIHRYIVLRERARERESPAQIEKKQIPHRSIETDRAKETDTP